MMELIITRRNGDRHVVRYDEQDHELIQSHNWHAQSASRTIYARASTKIYMHRLIMGVTDPKIDVDHRNLDGLDNRRSNLRVATRAQNIQNGQSRIGSSSRYKGVHWDERRSKWHAQIHPGGKCKFLGYFGTEVEAARAYDSAALALFGEFAHPNFPRQR